jgi:hypothetical protein
MTLCFAQTGNFLLQPAGFNIDKMKMQNSKYIAPFETLIKKPESHHGKLT